MKNIILTLALFLVLLGTEANAQGGPPPPNPREGSFITISSKTTASAGTYYVYYKVGSGSWKLAYSTTGSTTCAEKAIVHGLAGQTLNIAVENASGNGVKFTGTNTSTCPGTSNVHGGKRASACPGVNYYQIAIPEQSLDIALNVQVSSGNYVTCN